MRRKMIIGKLRAGVPHAPFESDPEQTERARNRA